MAKFEKRIKAQNLRKKGLSIKSIASDLIVSKSSVSIWCRDINLTKKQKDVLWKNAIAAGQKGRLIGAEMNKKKKESNIIFYKNQGRRDISRLSKRDFLIAGIGLYWGEGSKNGKLNFVNSDPDLILFMFKWFQDIIGVKKEDFIPRIFINRIHKSRVNKVLKFWSLLLELPVKQFRRTIFIKTKQKKIYENYDRYFGMLALRIRNSTNISYKILGLIDALKYQKIKKIEPV
ncbi:hypothetical protein COY96_02530 [Candidatus Wolfebacteria bacterium CG_4_10_14_0_8_um_filter_37_11]|uniref:Homing endonuclease LAGLIDADG domain-containing protein n=1 Tax=Candidatus Wolfebacteria bacterium CG_4_10_14_0_8_um_filter_37_11 TaxID=1975062 RepID=A0A2M7Q7A1_9BACT|nr:MAG: hypothetical protein COY96_02530 [Candidatus Wolfebacteria bacterium CG_4_10_14_0_8_um_filter_37_11]